MAIADLKALVESGEFHHATYRNQGTLWEGLHIYKRDPNGFRGYSLVDSFLKDSPELEAAYELTRGTGISVGSFGQG